MIADMKYMEVLVSLDNKTVFYKASEAQEF